jgi:hypothetical protein
MSAIPYPVPDDSVVVTITHLSALLSARSELVALKARRCDGCDLWLSLTPRESGRAAVGVCDDRAIVGVEVVLDWPEDTTAWIETRADHACNAWTPKENP